MSTTVNRALLAASWHSWATSAPRRAGPYWLQLAWTALFALPCALLFTAIGFVFFAKGSEWANLASWWHWFQLNLGVSLVISFSVQGLTVLTYRVLTPQRIQRMSERQRHLLSAVVPIVAVCFSWPLGTWLVGMPTDHWNLTMMSAPNVSLGFWLFSFMFGLLMYFYFGGRARLEQANRRAAEAQLRLLQGQIEPHFLFNTLANVVGLIDADPQRARQMLESFIDYLRSSLGGLRSQTHTLGQEMALVEAYLRILALRMDDRLRVRLEVPAELHPVRLPTLLVQPLVENAIHHGLEPKVDGGEVAVSAAVQGNRLLIEVVDDGLGLGAPRTTPGRPAGAGTALANIRERLGAAYGAAAALHIENRPGGGVRARLELPWPLPTH